MAKKIILMVLLLTFAAMMATDALPATFSRTFKIRIFKGEKGLLINNKMVEGKWDFKYKIGEYGNVSSGDLSDGPMVSYSTIVIEGEITMDGIHPVLDACLKDGSAFKVDYINKLPGKEDDKTFDGCTLKSVKMQKSKKGGSTVVYTFTATSVF